MLDNTLTARSRPGSSRSWRAVFIADRGGDGPLPRFSKSFLLDAVPASASLDLTFLGIGQAFINGVRVGDEVLAPGWQSYEHRLVYSTHDVSAMLHEGENTIEAEVGPGWYSGRLGFLGQRGIYGTHRAVFAELRGEIRGSQRTIVASDATWRWTPSATLHADLYDGEEYDARLRCPDDDAAQPVEVVPFDLSRLEPAASPPVRRVETIAPVELITTPTGRRIVDFGRNVVGWTKIRTTGDAGTEITLRHAEVLEGGELGTRPLRSAAATDRFVLAGDGVEEWEPSYTYHGFRYVEVDGWPSDADLRTGIEAVIIRSDLTRTGWFRTSHDGLSRLHANVVASMDGNFVSIPTDCPQRDERLGWTGDIAVFAPTAMFLYDASRFLQSWLRDVALEQRPDGRIPIFVPEVPFPAPAAQANPQFADVRAAVWGDAATLVPAAVYRATGDVGALRSSFELMRRWVDGVDAAVGPSHVWEDGYQFGDWLDPIAPSDDPAAGATEPSLIATAYFAQSARIVAHCAAVLGDRELELHYRALAAEIAAAFRSRFVMPDALMTSDSQTAYAVAIQLGLLDSDEEHQRAGTRLAELVQDAGHRIGTGFVGTPLILDALTATGHIDDAYRLLLQTEAPSWLYAVSMGATTIWERWDSMLPDGTINPGEMTSFNHYALGAVADWLHSTVAGLSPDASGYTRIRIAPRPRHPIADAGATHDTPFGRASVDWRIDGDTLVVEATVPEGTTGVFDLENQPTFERGPGHHVIRVPATDWKTEPR